MFWRSRLRPRVEALELAALPTIVQISALRTLFGLLLDHDFDRCEDNGEEPLLITFLDELQMRLEQAEAEVGPDPDPKDAGAWVRVRAIEAALGMINDGSVSSEEIEIEIDEPDIPSGPGPANDD